MTDTDKRGTKALEACAWALKRIALVAELKLDNTLLGRASNGCSRCGSILVDNGPTSAAPVRTCAVCGLPEGSDGTIGQTPDAP